LLFATVIVTNFGNNYYEKEGVGLPSFKACKTLKLDYLPF
jgi:hypothetical protein